MSWCGLVSAKQLAKSLFSPLGLALSTALPCCILEGLIAPSGNIQDPVLSQKNVLIFCVGRDLLEGSVLDRNAHFMADRISDLAFRVQSIHILDDVGEEMVAAFQNALAQKPAFILVTGGMGPGVDDLTRESMAKASGRPLRQDKQAVEMLAKSYRRWFAKGIVEDSELNEARLSIADVPEGSICYENPIGTAPAVRLKVDNTTIFLLPGVPAELQRLFTLYVVPALSSEGPGTLKKAIHVEWPGGDESALKRTLTDIGRHYPGLSSRARVQGDDEVSIRISLFAEHADEAELDRMLEKAEADLRARLGLELPTRVDQSGQ